MDEELDLVTLTDEDGKELTMEVLDYFFYEGQEYAVMAEYDENACDCEEGTCEGCEQQRDAFIMKVQPVGDDEEEFVPIEDELADKLIEFVNTELYADDDDGEYEDEEEDEGEKDE